MTIKMTGSEMNGLGWGAVVTSWLIAALDWITHNGNDVLLVISGILGVVFLIYKIKMIRIELRIKRRELEKHEK